MPLPSERCCLHELLGCDELHFLWVYLCLCLSLLFAPDIFPLGLRFSMQKSFL